jgi:general secretion pathway protein D
MFRYLLISIGLLAAGLAGCGTSELHREGLAKIQEGRYEEGLQKLEEAATSSPGNVMYRLDLKAKREEAIRTLIGDADRARSIGKLDEAEQGYRRVIGIEAGSDRALRGLKLLERDRRHIEIMAQAQRDFDQGRLDEADARVRTVLAEDPGLGAANSLRAKIDSARGPRNVVPRLKTKDNRSVVLQFRDASTKMVFEVLARQTGINFIFDKDIKSDGKTTIFVQNVPVEQAIDLVLGQNQLARQVLADNMVLIYPNTPAKQAEYQDQIVRTFYLTNAEPKRAMEMLKTMINARTMFVDERAGAIVIRDTPEAVRMAERLIASIDVPESEVMMEVEVLELTRSTMQELGIKYPQSVTLTPTPLAGDPLVLEDLRNQDSTTIQVSSISATIDLAKTVGTTNVLASPRIRARNHEKANILIGQRVPVITSSTVVLNSGDSQSTNVQYVDVGLKLAVEPTIYLDGDVAIKVDLEVSSIISTVQVGETIAYQLGTRNASTVLRLKDGETQILAGLIGDTDRRTSTHIPGLGDMPLIGRLFGSRKDEIEKTEIVLSITPRIIRTQPRPGSEDTEFWYGTQSSLRSAPLAAGGSSTTSGGGSGDQDPISGAGGYASDSGADASEDGGADQPKEPLQRPTLSWDGPGQVKVGQEFDVVLRIASEAELSDIRSMVRFDSAVFEVTGADAGDVVPGEARESAKPTVDQRNGRTQMVIKDGAVRGEGALLTLHVRALSPRPASMIAVQQFAAVFTDGRPVPALAPRPLVVVVTP